MRGLGKFISLIISVLLVVLLADSFFLEGRVTGVPKIDVIGLLAGRLSLLSSPAPVTGRGVPAGISLQEVQGSLQLDESLQLTGRTLKYMTVISLSRNGRKVVRLFEVGVRTGFRLDPTQQVFLIKDRVLRIDIPEQPYSVGGPGLISVSTQPIDDPLVSRPDWVTLINLVRAAKFLPPLDLTHANLEPSLIADLDRLASSAVQASLGMPVSDETAEEIASLEVDNSMIIRFLRDGGRLEVEKEGGGVTLVDYRPASEVVARQVAWLMCAPGERGFDSVIIAYDNGLGRTYQFLCE